MRVSAEIINQIVDRCDIVEIISQYIHLKKAGRNFKANCPFHHEKTPSFIVSQDKQLFHCFGCHEGGNVIGFIMKQERLDFLEAVAFLADKVNIKLPEETSSRRYYDDNKQKISDINKLTSKYFHDILLNNRTQEVKDARHYLKNRGISLETAKQFQLGFALNSWDGLLSYLKTHNISVDMMQKAGLIICKDDQKNTVYDRFRDRIIFPIWDTRGFCIAFGARTLKVDDNTAKYINSPETQYYKKGKNLYGLHFAKSAITEQDSVIIVEGYLDCIMPYQYGKKNIVASLGTALTIDQIRLISRYTKNVFMLFDSDKAGQAAMMRSIDLLVQQSLNVRIVKLKEGEDPDSFIRSFGIDAFKEKIKQSQDVFDYQWSILSSQYDDKSIHGKADIAQKILKTISMFDNAVVRSGYIKRLSGLLQIPEQALGQEYRRITQKVVGGYLNKGISVNPKQKDQDVVSKVEKSLLQLLLWNKDLLYDAYDKLEVNDFKEQSIRIVISELFNIAKNKGEINHSELINCFEGQ